MKIAIDKLSALGDIIHAMVILQFIKKYNQKITLKIKGTEVTRDADDDNPAYRIEQSDGDEVLKSHSELKKA